MDKKLYDLIDSYAEDFAAHLTRWIQVPSVKDEAAPGAPFGKEVRRMYDMALADCEAEGLVTRGFDGYALDATLPGESEEAIAVLGHLDVVPAGDSWPMPPFAAVREGDRIYGRGTSDDKGPSLCALYAIKAIKEAGIPLKKSIRLILGCDEESGWEDMAYYAQHADMPDVGFSPDASFPLINTEKAMLHLALTAPVSPEGLQVKKMYVGERTNVIPGESKALLAGGEDVAAKVAAYAERTGLPYTAEVTAEGVWVTAEGIPGHSAYPEGRRNAIGMMLLLLRELGVQGAFATLAEAVGMQSDGASLGCACQDAVSGPLTCNMGILHLEKGVIFCTLDMRVPITADLDQLSANAKAALPGFTVVHESKKAPHHVPAESELVSSLLAAYHEETGLPAEPQSTGGGTYAKVLKQGVAFGAAFPDDEDLAHQAGEYVSLPKMMTAMKIYANALVRLAGK
ncbi:MAG: Sapep family Mn(2+)-dependent dipeptidase [Clostridiales bacterium]|nr:Sapep family Mn(2+)-dependent dipeptidase [Clostridiales bacterium]